jgi:hypothetical protein
MSVTLAANKNMNAIFIKKIVIIFGHNLKIISCVRWILINDGVRYQRAWRSILMVKNKRALCI